MKTCNWVKKQFFSYFFFLENMQQNCLSKYDLEQKAWAQHLLQACVCAYLHDGVTYTTHLFFAVITAPLCMLLSSLHDKYFTDNSWSNVENGTAVGGHQVQEGSIHFTGSETLKHSL